MDINAFVGLPFRFHGRNFDGVDCYGLAMLFNRELLNIRLPEVRYQAAPTQAEVANAFAHGQATGLFTRVEKPTVGDLVFLRVAGLPSHCGVALGDGRFLHVGSGFPSRIEYLSAPEWRLRILGYYRYEAA